MISCFRRFRSKGKVPLSPAIFVADHLRKAAKATGIVIEDGHRFGLHNFRHSLSNWLVNKAKVEPKTVQGILRHSRIQTTMDLYTQDDADEARIAQGKYLEASSHAHHSSSSRCGTKCGTALTRVFDVRC